MFDGSRVFDGILLTQCFRCRFQLGFMDFGAVTCAFDRFFEVSNPWLQMSTCDPPNFKAPSMPWRATCDHGQCPGSKISRNGSASQGQDFHVVTVTSLKNSWMVSMAFRETILVVPFDKPVGARCPGWKNPGSCWHRTPRARGVFGGVVSLGCDEQVVLKHVESFKFSYQL